MLKTMIAFAFWGMLCSPVIVAEPLVSQPRRAIDNPGWEIKTVTNRDYWQFLSFDMEAKMPKIKEIDFYKDGGRHITRVTAKGIGGGFPVTKYNPVIKTIALRQIEIIAPNGKNVAPEAEFKVEDEGRFVVRELRAVNDRDDWTTAVIREPCADIAKQFVPIEARVVCALKSPAEISKVIVRHGAWMDAGTVGNVELEIKNNDKWEKVARSLNKTTKREMEIVPEAPIGKTAALRLRCFSEPFYIKFEERYLPDMEHLKTHAFYMNAYVRANQGDVFSMRSKNFDKESFEKFLADYKETFWGFDIPEWDSNMRQILAPGNPLRQCLPEFIKNYASKEQGLKAFQWFFDQSEKLLFGKGLAHSGNITTTQYSAAFGADVVLSQTSGIGPALPVRSVLMALRGGARQFDVPWIHYDSCIWREHPRPGTNYGKATCQLRRELITSYYMGANGHELEGDEVASFDLDEKGDLVLGPRGKVLQDLYRWHKSGKGERGESYTPFLFLVDYKHGHTGRNEQWGEQGYKTWNWLPFDDGDYMHEHFMRTVDKRLERLGCEQYEFTPPYGANIRNSPIGDICDIFFANPPQHGGAVKTEHIEKYPVVFLLGDIDVNPVLEKRLREYVKNGGALVVNAAQCGKGPLANPEFTGLTVTGEKARAQISWTEPMDLYKNRIMRANQEIMKVELKDATALWRDEQTGLPLLTQFKYGEGNVLMTTPYYMLMTGKTTIEGIGGYKREIDFKQKASPFIERVLTALQKEVLPIQVDGDIQFLMNKIGRGHWKVVLNNNKGVIKPGEGKVTYVDNYAVAVTLTIPGETAKVEETFTDAKVKVCRMAGATFAVIQVKPGETKVVAVTGADL